MVLHASATLLCGQEPAWLEAAGLTVKHSHAREASQAKPVQRKESKGKEKLRKISQEELLEE